jgi:hypothetical protein
MAKKPDQKEYENATERGDAILKRMLKTPPKLHKEMKKGKAKGSQKRDEKEKPRQ